MTEYLEGPNQLIRETEGLTTTRPDGVVDIRKYPEDPLAQEKVVSVPGMLMNAAQRFPDKMAMAVKRNGEWKEWTYQQYLDQSRTVAKAFIKLGLERFHSVCILGFNSPEWILSQMGAIMAGGISVGVYTTNTPEACRYVADHCRANIVVVEDAKQLEKILKIRDDLKDHLRAIVQYSGQPPEGSDVLSWSDLVEVGRAESEEALDDRLKRVAVNQCCSLVYTSGTTGQPKGTMMSHDNLTWTAKISNQFLDLSGSDSILSYLPLSHSAAQMTDVWMTLEAAGSVYFANSDALKGSLAGTLREVRPTVFFGVPRVFEKMAEKMQELSKSAPALQRSFATWAKKTGLNHNIKVLDGHHASGISYPIAKKLVFDKVKEKLGFDRARLIGVGAAPISKETLDYFLSLDIVLLECYGMSETSGPHHGNKPGQHKYGTAGPNLVGCRTMIHEPDPEGKGEICMNSRNVMMGYLFNPEETKKALDEDGWIHSGDIGCLNNDTSIKITGRIKELIITAGGENVPPLLIEDAIKAELPCVSNVMVIGDKRKFLSCLLTLKVNVDPETMGPTNELAPAAVDWLKSIDVKAKTVEDVLKKNSPDHDRTYRAIQEGIDRANQRATSNAQRVQKWIFVPQDFSIPGGELGPTMKLKRHYVLSKYATQINNLYNVA